MLRIILFSGLTMATNSVVHANLDQLDPPAILVTGQRLDANLVEEYVDTITMPTGGQIARYHKPVCPLIMGFSQDSTDFIGNRIRQDAQSVGTPIEMTSKCAANLIIILAENGGNLMLDIRKNQPGWIAGLSQQEIDSLVNQPGNVRSWTLNVMKNEDGIAASSNRVAKGGSLDDQPVLRVMSASIIKQPFRIDIEASFVIIDKQAVEGLSLTQIADYAAMRGFINSQSLPTGYDARTILALFVTEPSKREMELSAFDIGYLRAIYGSPGTMVAVQERARIIKEMADGN
jgi:hypothetical protein